MIHGGSGENVTELTEHGAAYRDALIAALDAGAAVLIGHGDAVAAVQSAVEELESCELFNAGRGSALCADGSVQMSAALMRGRDRAAGAVAGVTTTEHPIAAARCVLDSPQVLVLTEWADALAAAAGAVQRSNDFFVAPRQQARLAARREADHGRGTVGAVSLDERGMLAAATSTGGLFGQPPGRVGDTPVIGAGTWADQRVAVSCTGHGEAFIRVGAARQVAMLMRAGMTVDEAADHALRDVRAVGGGGGLIAVDATGRTAAPFSSRVMPGGLWREGKAEVWVTDSHVPDLPGTRADT